MPPRDYYAQRTGGGSSTQNRNTGQSGGQSGGPPGRGDTGPSQAAIESARRANEASAARREIEQRQQEEQDYFDTTWAEADRTKSAKEVYGKGAVPAGKRQQYTHETMGHQPWISKLIQDLSPETLEFWGVKSGAQTIPQELYQQLIQGSIVSGGEDVETQHLYDTGQKWASGADVDINPWSSKGISVGTWEDIGAGEHPMFPGGLQQYYSDMAPSFYADKPKFDYTGSLGGPGGGWGYGGGGGQGGYGYYGDPRRGNPIEQMAGFYTPQANLQQAMINVHNVPTGFQMKRGGIVSLLRLN